MRPRSQSSSCPSRSAASLADTSCPSAIAPDLAIREPAPHRLSRAHFSLIVRDGEVVVRDLNSSLGTIVNDRPLGRSFPRDSAPLHKGENTLIAGGKGSPFVFTLTLP